MFHGFEIGFLGQWLWGEADDGGVDFWRWGEGGWGEVVDDLGACEPLGDDGEAAVGFGVWACCDAICDFFLEHERHGGVAFWVIVDVF